MNIKKFFITTFRLLGICVAMIVSYIVAQTIADPDTAASLSADETAQAGMALLAVSVVNALLLAYPISRSRWYGLKLVGATLLVLFGVQTFMSQIETIFFGVDIPTAEIRTFFLSGLLTALVFSFLAVFIMGKMRKPKNEQLSAEPLKLSAKDWAVRLVLLPLAYLVIYFLFGYFIAWQSPDVREFYTGSTAIEPLFTHLANIFQDGTLIIPFQFVRGLIWVGLSFPILRMMKGGAWEKAIVIGLLFGLLLTTQLLFPNPYMPAPVRLAHFIETSTSTFLYGLLVGVAFKS